MNLNFQYIINESIEDNPKIENMMFHFFNKKFFPIFRDEDNNSYKTGYRFDNIVYILTNFGELVGLDYNVVLYFFIKWTLDPKSKWNEEEGRDVFDVFSIDDFGVWREPNHIYNILKKLDWFNKRFMTGKLNKDGDFEKLNYYDNMSFNDTEGLYPNMVLSVDDWEDFSELFNNRDLAEQTLSEDYSDLFFYY